MEGKLPVKSELRQTQAGARGYCYSPKRLNYSLNTPILFIFLLLRIDCPAAPGRRSSGLHWAWPASQRAGPRILPLLGDSGHPPFPEATLLYWARSNTGWIGALSSAFLQH